MKLLTILGFCSLVGIVVADNVWTAQKEYEYEYRGRLMTGIPELAPHYAGLIAKCTVIVQAQSDNKLYMKAKDVEISKINQEIRDDWKSEEIPAPARVSSDMVHILESPVIINVNKGVVQSVVVSGEEPMWSLNWKKALVSLLQVNLAEAPADSENSISRQGGLSAFYKIKERGVHGECETIYNVASLPKQLVIEHPEWVPVADACAGGHYLHITKTKNFNNCQKLPAFHRITPGVLPCQPGSAACQGLWSRGAVSRYIACGTHSNFAIQKVYSDGEVAVNILGYKTEKIITSNNQTLTLRAMRSISAPLAEPASPVDHRSVMFQMPAKDANSVERGPSAPTLKAPPNVHVSELWAHIEALKKLSPSDIADRIMRLLNDVAKELEAGENVAEKDTAGKVLAIAQSMNVLDLQGHRDMFQRVESTRASTDEKKEIMRSIFLDSVVMCGTNPAVMLIKELVMTNKLTGERAVQMIMALPKHIKTPTMEVLNEIFEIVKSNAAAVHHQLKATAALVFSNLINHACIRQEVKQTMYLEELYGEFCNPRTPEITTKFIPHFQEQLKSTDDVAKIVLYLKALGNIGHEAALPTIIRYIEGKDLHSESGSNSHIRSVALFALARIASVNPENVIPVLLAIINNPAEDPEIRMAAVAMVPYVNPHVVHWQKMALRTWFEPNRQVAAFIHTTLDTLSKSKDPVFAEMSKKAAATLPLAKPIAVGIQHSHNKYITEYLDKLGLGVAKQLAWINGNDSIIPHNIFYRQINHAGKLKINAINVNVFGYGVEALIHQLYKEFVGPDRDDRRSEATGISLEEIKRKLNIEPRTQLKPEGSAYVRVLDLVDRFFVFDKNIVSEIIKVSSDARSYLEKGLRLNHQKVVSLVDVDAVVPSEMGLPLAFTVKMPVLVSIRGHAHLDTASSAVTAQIKPIILWKMTGQVSVVSPFTTELITVGVDKHMMFNTPAELQVRADRKSGKVTFGVTPVAHGAQHEMFHFHTRPFLAVKSHVDFTPATIAPNVFFIKSRQAPAISEFAFGGNSIGMKFNVVHKADHAVADLVSLYQESKAYSPMSLVHFWWTKPSLHMHDYRVIFDAANSDTKKIETEVSVGIITKYQSSSSQTDANVDPGIQRSMDKVLAEIESGTVVSTAAVLKLMGRNVHQYKAAVSVGVGAVGLKQKLSVHVERDPISRYDSNPFKFCINGDSEFPSVPMLDRAALLSAKIQAKLSARIGYGTTCQEKKIDIKGELKRSAEMVQFANTSPEAQICNQQERQGIRASYHCNVAKTQAAALNDYDITISYDKPPAVAVDAMNMVEVALKAALMPYLSEDVNSARGEDQKIRVLVKQDPTIGAATISIFKPRSSIVFSQVRLPATRSGIVGVNARFGMLQQTLDEAVGGTFSPVCLVQNDAVRTFDWVKYEYRLSDCHHVLMKDCSEPANRRVAVLAKNIAGKKAALALLGDTKVEIIPESSYFSSTTLKIKVNEKEVDPKQDNPVAVTDSDGKLVAEISRTVDNAVRVVAHLHRLQVIADGVAIIVKASHVYRGRVCGLCGDMNGEAIADMRSPRQCVLSSPRLAAYTYMMSDAACGRIPEAEQSKIQQEEQSCIRAEIIPTPVSAVVPRSFSARSCERFRHIVYTIDGKKCISMEQLRECTQRCRPTKTERMKIPFHCPAPSDPDAEELIRKAEEGTPVNLVNKRVSAQKDMYIPDRCKA